MAVRQAWTFLTDPIVGNKDSVGGVLGWDNQSASNSGTRNSGGTTVASSSPTRVTHASIGGIDYARLRSIYGDNFISGSGSGYRTDLIQTASTADAHEGDTRVYRMKILLRKGVDYTPISGNWNTAGFEFHHILGGWPGGVGISINYQGVDNSAPFQLANIASGITCAPGDLTFDCFGGTVPTANFSPTPSTICYEKWPLFKAGTWESKVLDIAAKICWKSNYAESSGTSYYYKDVHSSTGTPTDFTNSGWVEIQYRLGTISGSTTTWGSWTWYDGGTITYTSGGKQVWVNGPDPHRHYRPTIFRALDTSSDTTAYWKLANYHDSSTDGAYDSSIYVADPQISDTWTDLGLAEPGASGGGGSTIVTAPGILQFGVTSVDTAAATPLGDLLNYKRGTPIPSVVPVGADNFTTGYEYGYSTGTVVRKMMVYAVGGGLPTTLVATSAAKTITAGAATWIAYTFPQTSLTSYVGQTLVLATIMGSADNSFYTYKTTLTNGQFLSLDNYSTGPSATWSGSVGGGFTGTYSNQLCLALAYNLASGGSVAPTPVAQTATHDNNTLSIHFGDALDAASVPQTSSFSLIKNGVAVPQPTDAATIVGQDVTMRLPFNAISTDVITITYTAPTKTPLRDSTGTNNVATFGPFAVTNNATAAPYRRVTARGAGTRVSNPGGRVAGEGGGGV